MSRRDPRRWTGVQSGAFTFTVAALLVTGCASPVPPTQSPALTATPTPTATSTLSSTPVAAASPGQATPSPTPVAGRTVVVRSAKDAGPGTLRQALLDAQPGDTILFDPAVFPPKQPKTIAVATSLPDLDAGEVTIDASNAGVMIDGSKVGGEESPGFVINSNHNVLRGLQVVGFTGDGIVLNDGVTGNVIGGDRAVGRGPVGQGNVLGDGAHGIAIFGADQNTIAGNIIGTDASGERRLPTRYNNIWIDGAAIGNAIGRATRSGMPASQSSRSTTRPRPATRSRPTASAPTRSTWRSTRSSR